MVLFKYVFILKYIKLCLYVLFLKKINDKYMNFNKNYLNEKCEKMSMKIDY